MRKAIIILLAVCFVLSLTAGAVSAAISGAGANNGGTSVAIGSGLTGSATATSDHWSDAVAVGTNGIANANADWRGHSVSIANGPSPRTHRHH